MPRKGEAAFRIVLVREQDEHRHSEEKLTENDVPPKRRTAPFQEGPDGRRGVHPVLRGGTFPCFNYFAATLDAESTAC
jgi:hypothetical protein